MSTWRPTLHLNGTSRAALADDWSAFSSALREAESACERASPNGRDYYPQGGDAIGGATREHQARCKAVRALREDANAMLEHIMDAP